MMHHAPASILLFRSSGSPAETLDAWLHAHFAEPPEVGSAHTLPEALTYLRSHRVDLLLVDEAAARTELRMIHAVSPATAIIALMVQPEPSVLLHLLRQGVHEALSLLPAAGIDHRRTIERALARVNGRTDILNDAAPRSCPIPEGPQLIHDLNNQLTSINGFADLLLSRLAPDDPARMNAEQIRLAGTRATTLLKAHAPAAPVSPPPSAPAAPPITARAA